MGGDPDLSRNRYLLWLLAVASIPVGIAGILFKDAGGDDVAQSLRDRDNVDCGRPADVGLGIRGPQAEGPGSRDAGRRDFHRDRAGACGGARNIPQRNYHFGRSVPQPGPAGGGEIFVPSFDTRHRRRRGEGFLGPVSSTKAGFRPDMHVPFAVGILVSAIVGCLTIKFFMDFLRRSTFTVFIIYRIVFGIIVIALANFFRFSGG